MIFMNTPMDDANLLPEFSRRSFLKTSVAASAMAATGMTGIAKPSSAGKPETLVAQLYKSFNDEQRKKLCFDWSHKKRSEIEANWHITRDRIGTFLNADQQDLVKQIFMGLHSEEYAQTVFKQVEDDSGKKGFGDSAIALFGKPGSGKFEFVLTGRHCTRRCDGDSLEGAAFGGPIFYGHAAGTGNEGPDHKGNAYWYQAKRANEVFQALDGKQRAIALEAKGRNENGTKTVNLTGKKTGLDGIRMADLSKDQQGLVLATLSDLLAPFRESDRQEVMKLVAKNGTENLHMAFYKKGDIGNDKVWDVWQIEGPAMVWYFRGSPHVHTWANIRASA
ncbi:MAG: hypothetical protein ACI9OD_001563 [Limisphaerales bacterium]|jgi:hypothetical protein